MRDFNVCPWRQHNMYTTKYITPYIILNAEQCSVLTNMHTYDVHIALSIYKDKDQVMGARVTLSFSHQVC